MTPEQWEKVIDAAYAITASAVVVSLWVAMMAIAWKATA